MQPNATEVQPVSKIAFVAILGETTFVVSPCFLPIPFYFPLLTKQGQMSSGSENAVINRSL